MIITIPELTITLPHVFFTIMYILSGIVFSNSIFMFTIYVEDEMCVFEKIIIALLWPFVFLFFLVLIIKEKIQDIFQK